MAMKQVEVGSLTLFDKFVDKDTGTAWQIMMIDAAARVVTGARTDENGRMWNWTYAYNAIVLVGSSVLPEQAQSLGPVTRL